MDYVLFKKVIENMRKSPSLIPNGGSLEASAGDVTDVVPHVEEPSVSKDVTTAEVKECLVCAHELSLYPCLYAMYIMWTHTHAHAHTQKKQSKVSSCRIAVTPTQ